MRAEARTDALYRRAEQPPQWAGGEGGEGAAALQQKHRPPRRRRGSGGGGSSAWPAGGNARGARGPRLAQAVAPAAAPKLRVRGRLGTRLQVKDISGAADQASTLGHSAPQGVHSPFLTLWLRCGARRFAGPLSPRTATARECVDQINRRKLPHVGGIYGHTPGGSA